MNKIRQIQELNKRELENGVSPSASWHSDYRDSAYIYIGGLPFELSEGDIITIFSQFGEPTYVNLVRDKETGKSKGFAFLKYEDQRSTDLAVDNLGGTMIMKRMLSVDHTRYKKRDDEPDEGQELNQSALEDVEGAESGTIKKGNKNTEDPTERPMLKEERELALLLETHDDDDPMKAFLIQEKKEEIAIAMAAMVKDRTRSSGDHKKRRQHHRSDRSGVDKNSSERKERLYRESDREKRSRRSSQSPEADKDSRQSRKTYHSRHRN